MGFNYAREKLRFDTEWKRLYVEYRNAGFEEPGIQSMYDHDWELFKKRRIYENCEQELPSDEIDDCDNERSTLFQKFPSLTAGFSEEDFTGRYDWIESIDNPVLANRLAELSDDYKELLTLFVFDGYTQTEIAALRGCSQVAVSKKINRIKLFLKMGL